jgi:hypothetical protein
MCLACALSSFTKSWFPLKKSLWTRLAACAHNLKKIKEDLDCSAASVAKSRSVVKRCLPLSDLARKMIPRRNFPVVEIYVFIAEIRSRKMTAVRTFP